MFERKLFYNHLPYQSSIRLAFRFPSVARANRRRRTQLTGETCAVHRKFVHACAPAVRKPAYTCTNAYYTRPIRARVTAGSYFEKT